MGLNVPAYPLRFGWKSAFLSLTACATLIHAAERQSTCRDLTQVASVPSVEVATIVGHLPQLPAVIPALDHAGAATQVRVVWPSPTDNQQTLAAGTYAVQGKVPGTAFVPHATVTVTAATPNVVAPERRLEPFPLGDVTLMPGPTRGATPFTANRDKFLRGLAATNPDAFLYMFRDAFGADQPEGARPLGVWDNQTTKLRGHASGHYLSAIAQAYAGSAGDDAMREKFSAKMNYMIDVLHALASQSGRASSPGGDHVSDPASVPTGPGKERYDSDLTPEGIRQDYWNWGEGFISAYPPDQFIMLEQGAAYGGRDNHIWAPYYTLHKILAGLLDCYEVGGNEKALEVARGMGLWVHARLTKVPTETRIAMWNRYIAGEYGGMNEVLARLYRLTNDERFLECAKLFDNIDFFFGNAQRQHGLARNVDLLRGKHANQHIPQITGALETYRTTGDLDYYRVAKNFWEICARGYMYSIGGVAGARMPDNPECFPAEPDALFAQGFHGNGQNETCATYNLLKLTRQLFMYEQDARYMDYYERAICNHILASVAEGNPGNTYHVPLNPGAHKQFGNAEMDGFTCCNGTALESNTKLQDSIYFRSTDDSALYVNLFIASQLNWRARGITMTQATDFPFDETSRITVEGSGEFDLMVRVPQWARGGVQMTINDEPVEASVEPGTYVRLSRAWRDGDVVAITMTRVWHVMPVMDQPNIASLFYGPVLMAAQETGRVERWYPVVLDRVDVGRTIAGDAGKLEFQLQDAKLRPFFETYERHSVYFDVKWESQ